MAPSKEPLCGMEVTGQTARRRKGSRPPPAPVLIRASAIGKPTTLWLPAGATMLVWGLTYAPTPAQSDTGHVSEISDIDISQLDRELMAAYKGTAREMHSRSAYTIELGQLSPGTCLHCVRGLCGISSSKGASRRNKHQTGGHARRRANLRPDTAW